MSDTGKLLVVVAGGGVAWWLLSRKSPTGTVTGGEVTNMTTTARRVNDLTTDYGGQQLSPYAAANAAATSAAQFVEPNPIASSAVNAYWAGLGSPGAGGDLPQDTTAPLGDGSTSGQRGPNGPAFDPASGLMTPYR